MKILHVTTHLNTGGIGNYILSLSAALKSRGVSVAVASSGGNLEEEFAKAGVPHRLLDIRTKSELSPKVLKSIFTLSKIIKDEGIDLVHAHSRVSQVVSFFACQIAGVPYVTTCHGFFKTRMRRVFDTWGKRVIAISDAVKTHLAEDLGVNDSRIRLVYSGVDVNRFSKNYSSDEALSIKKELGLKEGPVVGNIGRLSPVKGQKFLLEAMKGVIAKRPDVQCLIVGDGPEEFSLKGLARSLHIGNSVRFVGTFADTRAILSSMDVFVFPSVKEGLGIALLEALAAGKACVASKVGGIGDIITSGVNGMLVDVGDVKAIESAVLSLLGDAKLRTAMGEKGTALVRERFNLNSMAEGIIKVYEEVLRG